MERIRLTNHLSLGSLSYCLQGFYESQVVFSPHFFKNNFPIFPFFPPQKKSIGIEVLCTETMRGQRWSTPGGWNTPIWRVKSQSPVIFFWMRVAVLRNYPLPETNSKSTWKWMVWVSAYFQGRLLLVSGRVIRRTLTSPSWKSYILIKNTLFNSPLLPQQTAYGSSSEPFLEGDPPCKMPEVKLG